jgi:hypothetical protein
MLRCNKNIALHHKFPGVLTMIVQKAGAGQGEVSQAVPSSVTIC